MIAGEGPCESLLSVTHRIREYLTSAALLPQDDAPDPPVPADEAVWGPPPDPYSGPPDGKDAWLADVPCDLLDEYLQATRAPLPAAELSAVAELEHRRCAD